MEELNQIGIPNSDSTGTGHSPARLESKTSFALKQQHRPIVIVLIVASLSITAIAAWANFNSPSNNLNTLTVSITPTPPPTTNPTTIPTIIARSPTPKPTLTPTKVISPTSTPQPTNPPQPSATHTPQPQPTATPTPDTTPPQITSMTGPSDGGTIDSSDFCFPMYIADNVTKNSSEFMTSHQFDSTIWTTWANELSPCFSNVAPGNHTFSVKARDTAGNESASITRTFTVTQ